MVMGREWRVVLTGGCPAWVISSFDETQRALVDDDQPAEDSKRVNEIMIAGIRPAGRRNSDKSAVYGESTLYANANETRLP